MFMVGTKISGLTGGPSYCLAAGTGLEVQGGYRAMCGRSCGSAVEGSRRHESSLTSARGGTWAPRHRLHHLLLAVMQNVVALFGFLMRNLLRAKGTRSRPSSTLLE